ncbi:unnamed protein product [Arctogadus glacialis]
MIVNEREFQSRAMYWELKRRAPPNVPVYQQGPLQDDVWEILDGDKDDFLVYDRCGLLTFHIVLPYSFLTQPYVEAAVRATSLKDICNCTETFLSGSMRNQTKMSMNSNHTADRDTTLPSHQPPHIHHHHHYHHHQQQQQHHPHKFDHMNHTHIPHQNRSSIHRS